MYTRIRKALDKKDNGFTLIELLVVIIIIGILAAIAIPIFLNQRKKAVDASEKSDARTIATQMETFFTDGQTYPVAADFSYTAPVLTIGTEEVVLSPGNLVAIRVNAPQAAFCVEVQNSKASRDMVYMSDAGGLQGDSVTDCSAVLYPTAVYSNIAVPAPVVP